MTLLAAHLSGLTEVEQEELRHQLEMDKQIVKGMQAEARVKAVEAETTILAAHAQLEVNILFSQLQPHDSHEPGLPPSP